MFILTTGLIFQINQYVTNYAEIWELTVLDPTQNPPQLKIQYIHVELPICELIIKLLS